MRLLLQALQAAARGCLLLLAEQSGGILLPVVGHWINALRTCHGPLAPLASQAPITPLLSWEIDLLVDLLFPLGRGEWLGAQIKVDR